MASTTAMCTSFKRELFEAQHNFLLSGGDAQKVALYASAATHGAATTAYSATNEVSGAGYTAAGAALTRIDPATSGTTAFIDFADVQWAAATITAASALIYKVSGGLAISVHDFGGDKTASGGAFDLLMPTADASNAVLRLA